MPQEWKKGTLTALVLCKDKNQISGGAYSSCTFAGVLLTSAGCVHRHWHHAHGWFAPEHFLSPQPSLP